MSGQGIAQIVFYAVVLIALAYPLGIYMARVYTRERAADSRVERGFLRLLGARRGASRTGRRTRRRCSSSASSSPPCSTLLLRLQGHLLLNPDHLKGVAVAHRAEHDRELRHEHELAVLRRRVHDVVPERRWPGSRCRTSSRPRSGWPCWSPSIRGFARRSTRQARELLARPLPLARLHPAAARARPGACS